MSSTPEETRRARYITGWIRHHELGRVIGTLRGGVALNVVYLTVLVALGASTSTAFALGSACIGALVADVYGLVAARRGLPDRAKRALLLANIWTIAGQLTGVFFNRSEQANGDTSSAAHVTVLATVVVILAMSTLRGRRLAAIAAFALALYLPSSFIRTPFFMCEAWVYMMPVAIGAATLLRHHLNLGEHAAGLAAYVRLTQVAPPAVIEHISQSHVSVDVAFKPTDRACVCLCSDWRDYQSMTAGMQSAAVVEALESYYAATDALLEECFPRGNYFSDWIADELFIVAFSLTEGDEADTAREAVHFAERLVAARSRIAAKTGVPRAIDVGLAAGTASVGLMGPPRHRKATALGETPGRSRRLQTAAKLLRLHIGPQDRVIVDQSVAALLAGEKTFQRWALPADKALRDVGDRELLYLEPAAEAVATRAA